MAELKEFAGYRYNPEVCGKLEDVMATPYNGINQEEQEAFYQKCQYNIIRVSNSKIHDGDNEEDNRYIRAGKELNSWISQGVLKKDSKPSMYLYEQRSIYKNTVYVNHGIVALLKLEEPGENSRVKICEENKSGFIEDRYNLLSATQANVDMINCMYIDYERPLNHLMNEIAEEVPDMKFTLTEKITGEPTENKLWVIDDQERIEFIKESLRRANLFITDGHNRYKAALRYMRECKANNPNHTGDEPYNYIMVFLTNAYGDNLVQLPVHRVLKTGKKFSEDYFIACAQDHFKVEKIIIDTSNDDLVETMKKQVETARRENIIGVYCGGNYFYRLTLTDTEYIKTVLPEHSKEYCMLDVTILNQLLLGELLNIGEEDYEEHIAYTKRTTRGVEMVNNKEASCLFVMNLINPERICEVVEAGETLPEKSIYIFPKAVTGVIINKI